MKTTRIHLRIIILFPLIIIFILQSCVIGKWTVPPDLVGTWKSDNENVTVRTRPGKDYIFTPGMTYVTISIDTNKTVSGFIGNAEFKNAVLKKNSGNPERTGVAYIVDCGKIGKIFPDDPLDNKEVQIWLKPIKGDMGSELRYTECLAYFPMGDLLFKKVNK